MKNKKANLIKASLNTTPAAGLTTNTGVAVAASQQTAPALSKQDRLSIVAQQMATTAGRHQIAASMQVPLREFRDYTGVGRRAFVIDELGQGELAYYDKDVATPAYVVGEEAQDIKEQIRGERIFVPLFELASNPMIPITQLRQRRHNLQDRVKTKVRAEIIREEDRIIFKQFSVITKRRAEMKGGNQIINVARSAMTIDHFSTAMAEVEQHGDIKCVNIFMNPVNNTVLRKINKDYYIDFETSRQLLNIGIIGSLYGATIHASSMVPKDEIYFCGEADFLGNIVVGNELTVLNADNPVSRQIGFSIFLQEGILIRDVS